MTAGDPCVPLRMARRWHAPVGLAHSVHALSPRSDSSNRRESSATRRRELRLLVVVRDAQPDPVRGPTGRSSVWNSTVSASLPSGQPTEFDFRVHDPPDYKSNGTLRIDLHLEM